MPFEINGFNALNTPASLFRPDASGRIEAVRLAWRPGCCRKAVTDGSRVRHRHGTFGGGLIDVHESVARRRRLCDWAEGGGSPGRAAGPLAGFRPSGLTNRRKR